jgi:hypothetical protein
MNGVAEGWASSSEFHASASIAAGSSTTRMTKLLFSSSQADFARRSQGAKRRPQT